LQIAASQGLQRACVAYDAPGGNAIGAIEQGRAYSVVARSGADWLQLDVDGSGLVWVKSGELNPDQANVPDLATPIPQPQPVYVYVPQPAQPVQAPQQPQPVEPQIEVVNVPAATPTPQPPQVVAQQQTPAVDNEFAASFTKPDPNAKCLFVGCLHQP
jgi:hypothetical protein